MIKFESIWKRFWVFAFLAPFALIVLTTIPSLAVADQPGSGEDEDDDDEDDDDDNNGQGGSGSLAFIGKLDDLALGTWGGAGGLADYSDHCVAASPNGTFSITAVGDGPGGAYQLSAGAATLPFHLFYRDKKNAAYVEIPPATPISGFKAGKKPAKCKHQKQRLEVRLLENEMSQVPAGAYSGTLVLMVTPL